MLEENQNQQPTNEAEMKMPEEPVAPGATMPTESSHSSSWLFVTIGILIVLLLIALGGLYLWGAMLMENEDAARSEESPMMTPEEEAAAELDALEAELQSEDFETFDSELEEIDAELQASESEM